MPSTGSAAARHERPHRPASSGPPNASVAVCAGEATLRERIAAALAAGGLEPGSTCVSLAELIDTPAAGDADVIVVACAFEPFTPSAEVSSLRGHLETMPLIVVASGFMGAAARKLVPAHVDGLVHEADVERALLATVNAVLAGQLCAPASMRGALVQPVFSHREKQVLELLLAGLTNDEIARELYLAESTVKSHLVTSFRKLGVCSRSEAARRIHDPNSGLELAGLRMVTPSTAAGRR